MSETQVSIAIPAFNAALWIEQAVMSALAQTVQPLEIVVVDDASSDATWEVVRQINDPRIALYRNEFNLGHAANWNKAIDLCNGRLIKLLAADDVLHEDCVEKMACVFDEGSNIGLVFSRRHVTGDEAWAARYGELQTRFASLSRVNSGRALFEEYLQSGFDDNWVGEPTNVMIAAHAARKLRFNPRLRQIVDMELWIRVLYHFDIGFIEEPLATYRIHNRSITAATRRDGTRRYDKVRLYEALLCDTAIAASHGRQLRQRLFLGRLRAAAWPRHTRAASPRACEL